MHVRNVLNVNFVTTINFIPDVDTEFLKGKILVSMILDFFKENSEHFWVILFPTGGGGNPPPEADFAKCSK